MNEMYNMNYKTHQHWNILEVSCSTYWSTTSCPRMFLRKPSLLLTTFLMLSTAAVEMSHHKDLFTFTMEDTIKQIENGDVFHFLNITYCWDLVSYNLFSLLQYVQEACWRRGTFLSLLVDLYYWFRFSCCSGQGL